jgi:prophage antirepressor-like protein
MNKPLLRRIDVLQHFVFNNCEYQVSVFEKDNRLWYRANDIAKVLGMQNIHSSITKLQLEKSYENVKAIGRSQNVTLLTYNGVCTLLMHSLKPIAKSFQAWLLNVVQEINEKGRYEWEQETERKIQHKIFLQVYHGKYVIYLGLIKEIDDKMLIKIGETKDIQTTFKTRHIPDYGNIQAIYVTECQLNEPFEKYLLTHKTIKKWLYKQPVKINGGKSNEVVLVTNDELNQLLSIIKANVHRYRSLSSENDETKQNLNELNKRFEDFKTLVEKQVLKNEDKQRIEINEQNDESNNSANHDEENANDAKNNNANHEHDEHVQAKPKRVRIRVKGTGKCVSCNDSITNRAVYCVKCEVASRPKKFDISKEELNELVNVQKIPFTTLGKRFGVSDNAIRKRCRALGVTVRKIHKPRQGAPAPNEQ